jgi:hypothetical protein
MLVIFSKSSEFYANILYSNFYLKLFKLTGWETPKDVFSNVNLKTN